MGVFPLFLGVELVLGIAILNKLDGVFAIITLLSNKKISLQLTYRIISLLVIPYYHSALGNIIKNQNNVRKLSTATLIYFVDTVVSFFNTFILLIIWITNKTNLSDDGFERIKDSIPNFIFSVLKSDVDKLPVKTRFEIREIYMIISAILVFSFIKVYFMLIMMSFARSMLIRDEIQTQETKLDFEETSKKRIISCNRANRAIYEIENKSKRFLKSRIT